MHSIIEIKYALEKTYGKINDLIEAISDKDFGKDFRIGKWNAAQQIEHLTLSNNMTAMALNMPKLLLKSLYKINNRANMPYEEVVWKYQRSLSEGAKATFAYQPKLAKFLGKNTSLFLWKKSSDLVVSSISGWDENSVDEYIIQHPIIGKITLRELLFFTIYHLEHHYKSLKAMYKM